MKRILALAGLVMVGAMLLADPNTGVVAVTETATTTSIAAATPTTAPPDPGAEDDTDPDPGDASSATDSSSTTAADTQPPSGDPGVTYLGSEIDSRFGAFQVEITVVDGVLTSITTVLEPGDRKSQRINDSAVPYYTEQAIELQTADIDAMSGATVTWRSWTASLRSALEMAGLA